VTGSALPHDPMWPRAAEWFVPAEDRATAEGDLALLGVPAHSTSISPSGANATPRAVREALSRYSTWAANAGADLAGLRAVDLGDVEDPDGPEGEARVRAAVSGIRDRFSLLVALGGDNSLTYPVVSGMFGGDLERCGLITLDAHHDVRDGESNGSPVRRLVEAGMAGEAIVQVGIADFANSAEYGRRAREYGITVIGRDILARREVADVAVEALGIAGAGGRRVFVDIDVDVCDRSAAPGCPASAPGGISAYELRRFARILTSDSRVRGIDITEVDATADAPDGRTVRLAALLVLEAAAGLNARRG
jgi:formiminoglutamase